jgi:outer membrane protein OmpA-like peptidoglycan-associated protein
MKRKMMSMFMIGVAFLTINTSCTAIKNANKTQKGAGIGVAGGALIGGLIGGNVKGALIGAAIGGAAGGVIGNTMDKQAKKIEEMVPGADVNRVGEGIQIIFDDKSGVNFALNSANLTSEAKANLDKVADVFLEFPDTELMLEGHTDSTGDAGYNMTLSIKRANAVADYLNNKGVTKSRITVKGLGETAPRFENDSKEGQAKNRRVEIGVTANKEMIEDAKAKSN